jgi:hypothetical protein
MEVKRNESRECRNCAFVNVLQYGPSGNQEPFVRPRFIDVPFNLHSRLLGCAELEDSRHIVEPDVKLLLQVGRVVIRR